MTQPKIINVDVAVIGAGTAGLSAVATLKRRTDRYVIIDDGPLGTTCARVGCMPSKAMIEVAHDLHRARRLVASGLGRGEVTVDGAAVMNRVRALRDDFASGPAGIARDPHFLEGRARFTSPNELAVGDVTVRAARIIIATGTTPIVPPPWRVFADRVLTSDTIFEIERPPRALAVIGAGAVGIELAQSLARLGSSVTTFATDRRIGGLTDPAVRDVAHALLAKDVGLHAGRPSAPAADPAGLRVTADDASVIVDRALVCVGRSANTQGLGLEALGVRLNKKGVPNFDRGTMRIEGLPTVFIAGDVTGHRTVMHEATFSGRQAALVALNDLNPNESPTPLPARPPKFSIVFADPNIASVGHAHADLIASNQNFVTGTVDYANQGRARTMNEPGGILNLYGEVKTGRLLGAEMICPGGEHLAHLLVFALAHRLTAAAVLDLPFYHPTLEEGLRTALVDLNRKARGGG